MAQTITEPRHAGGVLAASPSRLGWGAIFGGTFVAAAVWVLLFALGLALGFTTVDPANPGSLRASGIGTGIWSLVTPLIALFIGGWVAARSAGYIDRGGGALHGLVVWAFTTLAGILLIGMTLSSLLGGVFNLGRQAVGATGQTLPQAAQTLGLSANDLLGPVNERLQNQGRPTLTAQQLEATVKDVTSSSVRQGRFDRELLITSLEQNTELSRTDAEQIASQVEQQWQQSLTQAGGTVQQVAEGATDVGAAVFWGIFGSLVLGLISALLGGLLGARNLAKVARTERALEAPPVTGRREVYP